MNMEQTTPNINPGAGDAALDVARDMILLALDLTEAPNLSERHRLEARAALAEALDAVEAAA